MQRELTVEQGFENLATRIANDSRDLEAIRVQPDSPVWDEDAFLAPVYRPFSLCTKQPLGSALDHLEVVAETFHALGQPHSFAESTLIRTAITASSYALWLLSLEPTQRRLRVLQFSFKDYDMWAGFVRTESRNPEAPEDLVNTAPAVLDELNERRTWIVKQANDILIGDEPRTVREYRKDLPTDTAVVKEAGTRVLGAWRFLSGYAHGLPWATLANQVQVPGTEPHPETGAITVHQHGNPEQLLDAAFYTIEVIEQATARYRLLCHGESGA
ncbi:hypothetical protein NJB14197_39140 [Mycobacterium montefiorense]|uniref:Uncharacterized protein n=1 Tax=Mycobacterium montefiorense TaxID=154654 RepID=A0AA37UV70_9MYCO|nr:hypothetical protein MmonteBS_40400 [Mycobacterium montefiorense]GKU35539.1 hypothetical protein NJB14191_28850 [Mycobacterium montefiorense]GKU40544.1 hypothetical protein NJB14192_25310 [Mycobacterium montefiorense]GKU45047.1 hypothetical protein NJB14194_16710 [Mycobacterium montefiorense]GKU51197.1 hypothetical protein NJB14195_24430 [Mycobacterium montefiorense]